MKKKPANKREVQEVTAALPTPHCCGNPMKRRHHSMTFQCVCGKTFEMPMQRLELPRA